MKRLVCCILLIVASFTLILGGCAPQPVTYLRIHIRANSNSATDQAVKYQVRDQVVEYLTPKLKEVGTFDRAVTTVGENLGNIERVADSTLLGQGFSYTARAAVREEDFPTRKYSDLVLPAGRYKALIVELGTGTGDNWWCVAYPPLCFGAGDYQIKSKIVEFFESLF